MVKLIHTLADHDDDVNCCAFSSSLLATCSLDKPIRLYSLSDFSELPHSPLKFHTSAVHCCCFSASGHILASFSTDRSVDKSVIVYDTNTENILHTLTQHTRYVTTCAFAPNILLLATGSMDKTVSIWQFDLETPCQARIAEDQPKQFTEDWSEDDVSNWLCAQDLKDLVGIFKMNNIDGRELLNLTKESLADDLKIESLGLCSKVLQKIEELRTKMKTLSSGIPDEFICPITRELMKDPVIASDGYSYEKEAMENWISKKKRTSPMTNLVLPSVVLIPNRTLKMAIDRWLETHQK
ncbi:hypothetical protein EI555_011838 [Monodon monoceros]|uniref:WD repeat, SAM and U-box domain-containing protein 1 n=1 Tax=Monodon monoceros TaxID=40151 RepID=A0A4U1EZV2_MONMO|nr:hypothetical protein EI555_011838 [Monodon monoceros]